MVPLAKNILFVSDLSVNMKQVFEHAATLAACQDGKIIILHVMEEDPSDGKKVRMAFGEELYENLKSEQKDGARNILIGKNMGALKIRQAIARYFGKDRDIEAGQNDSLIQKISVAEGRSLADEIIASVSEEECDMIVMGCKQQSLLAEAMGDKLVRKILKRSSVPVLVVPFSE